MKRGDTLKTIADIQRAIAKPGTSVVLLDSGGFTWWGDEDEYGTRLLAGVASPVFPASRGMAIQAWMNRMLPHDAVNYGPFTVIHYEESE